MSTNYRVTTPQQFFDIHHPQDTSFLDQLGISLKKSLSFVWSYIKTIDVKNSLPKTKILDGQKSTLAQLRSSNDSTADNKNSRSEVERSTNSKLANAGLQYKDSLMSKRQKLRQKKQNKRIIDFNQFIQRQQKKLNESFILKNIQKKRSLNRSLLNLSQQQNSLIQNNQDNLNTSTNNIKESNNESILNLNNETILNISDIDSQCNFNILNNSCVYYKDESNGDDQENNLKQLNKEQAQSNIPKLQLLQYPFLTYGKKTQKNNKIKSLKNITYLNNKSFNKKHQELQPFQSNINQYIDVDQIPNQKSHKRNISTIPNYASENEIRKKVKQSVQFQYFKQKKDIKKLQRNQKFDKLLQDRYQKMIQDKFLFGQNNEETKKQATSLKQEYQKFINKNFSALQYVKKKVQNQSRSIKTKQQSTIIEKPINKISQILKPLDMSPIIQRKKLYNFTRECQGKINISEQLKKSVIADKQRQLMEQILRKQEQQTKIRMQEQQKRRRQQQNRRIQAEQQRKRKQKEQQAIKLAEKLRKQLEQQNQRVKLIEQQSNKQQNLQYNSVQQANQVQQGKQKVEETKPQQSPKQNKQPFKTSSLFATNPTSLFSSITPKQPLQSSLKQNKQTQTKQPQVKDLKKTSSVSQQKPIQAGKTVSSNQKNLQAPQIFQKSSQTPPQQQKKQKKYNPFLNPAKPVVMTRLQQIINSKKDDNSMFKTIIASTPFGMTSPQRQPQQINPNSYLSPVHNTSHLDSSMCEQSESNITPINSQVIGNNLGGQNLNGSFLNNSFSSQQQNNNLFQTNTSNSLFNTAPVNSLFGNAYNNPMNGGNLFGNTQQQPVQQSTGLFGANPTMFIPNMPSNTTSSKFEAVNKIPSFMQNHPSISPSISGINAASLFSQRSPSKNQPGLFAAQPSQSLDKKPSTRRDKKSKQERIR